MSAFTPTVSVVIGVYNGADKIGACLDSLLKQDYPAEAYEVIVVENGSTDNTTEIVQQYPVRLYHNSVRGLAAARNLGLARSEADIMATTDDDCIAHPHWLTELVKPYADPDVGGVGGAILAYAHPERNMVEMFSDDENPPLVNYQGGEHEFLPRLYGANASFRRNLLNQVGGFNPKLLTGEDVDVSWRIQLETGAKLRYAPEAIMYHHHRSSLKSLARLYRHYGFGEIVLDTRYCHYPRYPRPLGFQLRRLFDQAGALPRYALSAMVRSVRLAMGRATSYQAAVPLLWFVIESNNILGKLEGLAATRLMTDAQSVYREADKVIARLYGGDQAA